LTQCIEDTIEEDPSAGGEPWQPAARAAMYDALDAAIRAAMA